MNVDWRLHPRQEGNPYVLPPPRRHAFATQGPPYQGARTPLFGAR
jgi:hypothetical protein